MLVSIRKQGVGVIVKRVKIVIFRPYKKNFLFPIPARVTFEERIKKNFIFISSNLMYMALQLIVFW